MHKMQRSGAIQMRQRNVLTKAQKMQIVQQLEKVKAFTEYITWGSKHFVTLLGRKSNQSFMAKVDSAKAISDRKPLKGLSFPRT